MAKSLKKVIACLMAVLMIAFSMPFTAFAAASVTDPKYGSYHPDIQLQFSTFAESHTGAYINTVPSVTSGLQVTSGKLNNADFSSSGLFGPMLTANAEVTEGGLNYVVNSLKLEAAKCAAASEWTGMAAPEEDYTYGVGDMFTVTVCADNLQTINTLQAYIAYSDNIVPAATWSTGANAARKVFVGAETAAPATAKELNTIAPFAGQCSGDFYAKVNNGPIGDISKIGSDDKGVNYMNCQVSKQSGNKLEDISKITLDYNTADSGIYLVNPDGSLGNNYEGRFIVESFAFVIVDEGPITFSVYDPYATKIGLGGAMYTADASKITNDAYTTYAVNQYKCTDGDVNPGSTKMSFWGKNVNRADEPKEHAHTWDEGTYTKPTCTKNGYTTYTCTNEDGLAPEGGCEARIEYDNPETTLGHKEAAERKNVKAATCTEKGYTGDVVCSVCGATIEHGEETPALGHDYVLDQSTVKAATCGEKGYTGDKVCSHDATHVIKGTDIPALGHKWGEWKVVKEATEDEKGLERRVCENDPAHFEERDIPIKAHTHNFEFKETVAPTCTEEGYDLYVCAKDGETEKRNIVAAIGHEYELVGAKEATVKEDGYTGDEVCKHCGDIKSKGEVIPALGVIVTVANDYENYGDVTGFKYGENKVKYGDTVTLTAAPVEGAKFEGWQVSNKLVSKDATYSFTAYSDVTVTPVFAEKDVDTITVVFYDKYNNVVASYVNVTVADFQAAMATAIPAGQTYPGYAFKSWSYTDDQIKALDHSASIFAAYDAVETGYTVTTADEVTMTIDAEGVENGKIPYDTSVTLTATGATAWEIDGVKVAFGDTYTFFVGADVTVTPVYDAVEDAAPTVSLINASLVNNGPKVNFLATMEVPAGYTMIDHGFIYGKAMTANDLKIENVGKSVNGAVVKKTTAGATGSLQFALNYGVSAMNANATAVAYVTYQKGDEILTTYSNAVAFDYATGTYSNI